MPGVAIGNRLGNGLRFLGGQFVNFGIPAPSLQFQPKDAFSISSIFYLDSLVGGLTPIVTNRGSAASIGIYLGLSLTANTILFMFSSNGTTNRNYLTFNSAGFKPGLNTLTAVKGDSLLQTDMNVFLNGVQLVSRTVNGAGLQDVVLDYNSPASPLFFGKSEANFFSGIIYDIAINNQIISLQDHKKYFESDGSTIVKSSLVDQWSFDEKSGTVLTGKKGNAGTLAGFPSTTLGNNNSWVDKLQQPILS